MENSDLKNEKDSDNTLKRKLKRLWGNGLFRSVFTVIMLIMLSFAFQRMLVLVLKTEYPLQTPISNSMYPTLKVGDLLVVQGGLSGEDIHADPKNGDIIVFRHPHTNEFIVHRAIDKEYIKGKWWFRTKGDNPETNPYPDSWLIPEDRVIGKVIFVIPYLGYIKIYLGNRYGILLLIALFLAFIIFENWNLISRGDHERKKKLATKDI